MADKPPVCGLSEAGPSPSDAPEAAGPKVGGAGSVGVRGEGGAVVAGVGRALISS